MCKNGQGVIEIIFTYPSGKEEIRYRAPRDSEVGQNLISEVKKLKELIGSACPYRIRDVREKAASQGRKLKPASKGGNYVIVTV